MTPFHYSLAGVEVRYADRLALQIERLDLAQGELHLLMGANGAGKSTLLRLLAFLEKPHRGQVAFSGTPVAWNSRSLRALRRRVTLLHQHPYLFTGTVFSNIALGPKARGMRKAEIAPLVSQLLAMVGLQGFEARNARHLSGGQASRVALARALACQPEVLLLDEPLAQTDKESAAILRDLIASLPAQGITVVLSSHEESLADEASTNLIQLDSGRVLALSPASIFPASQAQGVDCDCI